MNETNEKKRPRSRAHLIICAVLAFFIGWLAAWDKRARKRLEEEVRP